MKASDYIARFLQKEGVTHVFELVGGMITFLIDSLATQTTIKVVSMHHEQAAGFAAEGYARMRGRPGVALATSGPGATNLLTAVGSCYFDSVPAVFITGQVNLSEQRGQRAIRQLGFQETDIVAMSSPVTKRSHMASSADEVSRCLREGFELATEGRPGPVLLDIPLDVQRSRVESPLEDTARPRAKANPNTHEFAREVMHEMRNAARPMILVGGGIRAAMAAESFRAFVCRCQVPVVHSLMGVDVLAYSHPLRVGMIGSYGNRWANVALSESDCLLVLGSRLDVRQTGADTRAFRGSRKLFHVDCENGELNNRITDCRALVADLKEFFAEATKVESDVRAPTGWLTTISGWRNQWPDTEELKEIKGINPNRVLHALAGRSQRAAAYVVDVGQHQMWAAQSLELTEAQRFLTSGGMGAMGFGLPASIGACFASSPDPVVLIAGDGGFQCNIQELQTVARNQLPLKIVIINNNCHGMVRQFQESYFKKRYNSTMWGYSAPNFTEVARAYSIPSRRVEKDAEIGEGIEALWEDPTRPFLLEVMIDASTNAYPKMAFGRPPSEMEPFAKPTEMEGT